MNRAYKLVWNTVSNSWVVASELAKGAKKSSGKTLKLAVLMAAGLTTGMATAAPAVNALPSGESVVAGVATFDRTVANQLTVNQGSSKLITNWNSFDVGSNAKVTFAQPDAASVALNRVTGGSVTEIFGKVTANGQLVLVNPNGITFGAGSQVSAASIIGSVMDIQDSDFNAGTLLFSRGSATGTIDNQGSLSATAGSVSLLAPTVKNSGTISATGGNAALINANAVNLTAADPSVITVSTITGLIQQSGGITATQVSSVGGKILLKGDTSQSASKINVGGTVNASSETAVDGRVINVSSMLDVNGTNNTLKLTHVNGYNLNSPVNLNGASSGFSVNGAAYTVIRNVTQLQGMTGNRAGNYVLGNDIDATATSGWNAGQGFAPIGVYQTAYFTGRFDGLGHVINNLTINRPGEFDVALLGAVNGADIRNIGLSNVTLHGSEYVGGIVSFLNASSISNSFVTGVVTGTNKIGGVAGAIESGSSVSNSYSAATVTGSGTNNYVGGLIGVAVTLSTVSNSYATGAVSGGTIMGGLAGAVDNSTLSSSYWNTQTTGQSSAISVSNSIDYTLTNVIGLNTSQFSQLASYANWGSNIDAQGGTGSTWRIYEGQSAPLLRTFLKTLNAATATKTYDATAYTAALPSGINLAKVLGTAVFSGDAIGAINAGTYAHSVTGLYSVQDGYDIVDTGKLTINKASLSISATDASKVYDGTTSASASTVISSGSLFGTDTISGGSFAFADKHAGTGKHVLVSGVTVNDGNNGGNYDITYVDNTNSSISKRQLTISASDASKEYDGKLTSADKPVVVGRQRGDSIVGLTQSYLDKNAGTGKAINVNAGYTIRDGNGGNNYDVVIVNSNAGVITPKALTISTVANSKVYDGGLTSANKPLVTGLITGDRITGLYQQYETKTVGENKKLLIKNGYVVQDGNSGGNYSVTEQGSMDGVITAH